MSDATREEIGVASSRYRQHLYSEKPIREIYPKAADESEAWARWQADKTVCANAFLQVQTDWICLLNDGARIDDQIEALQADLTTARAEIERLRAVLRKWLITPEYDFPGDAPELCGFSCLECKSEAATENAIEHKPECVLAAARQEG